MVAQCRVDAALGRSGVTAGGMHLRQNGHIDTGNLCFDGRAETGQTPSDNYQVMMDHLSLTLPN
jgi:hypothetical protein